MDKRPATQKRKKDAKKKTKTARQIIVANRRGMESAPEDIDSSPFPRRSPLSPRRLTDKEVADRRAARHARWMASWGSPGRAAEKLAEKAARIAAWEAERIAKAQAQCLAGSSSTAAVEAEEEALLTPVMQAARLAKAARESLADCQMLTRLPGWKGEAWIGHVPKLREKVQFYEKQERLAREKEQKIEEVNSMISSTRLSPDPSRLAREEEQRIAREEQKIEEMNSLIKKIEEVNSRISSIRSSQDPSRLAGYKRKTSKKYRKHRSSRKKHRSSRKKHRKHRTRR